MSTVNRKILKKRIASYQRNHTGSDFGDVERSKIERDKMHAVKARTIVEQAIPKNNTDVLDEDMEAYGNALHAEKKARGNAKTHQERYKKLLQDDDFQ